MELVPQRLLTTWPFGETGMPGPVVHGPEHFAVCSTYGHLYWPGRAVYDGHAPRHRLALYSDDDQRRVAVFDGAHYPINDVAFHPTDPVLAIATGTYDGGYAYEGQLFVWNWQTGAAHDVLAESRQIMRCRFEDDGRLVVFAKPPTDEETTTYGAVTDDLRPRAGLRLEPATAAELGFDSAEARAARIRADHARLGLAHRGPIWDLAWTPDGRLAAVYGDAGVALWSAHGTRECSLGSGSGAVQLLRQPERMLVHALDVKSQLFELRGTGAATELVPWVTLPQQHACSVDATGRVLARSVVLIGARTDVVVSPAGELVLERDIGGYDVFNHFLRIDGERDLYYLRGPAAEAHRKKVIAAIDSSATIPWDGAGEQLMAGSAVAVGDDAFVRAYVVYHPHSTGRRSIERIARADGALGWRHDVGAAAIALVAWPAIAAVVAALVDGTLCVLGAATGDVYHDERFTIDGVPTIVTAIAIHDESLAVATIDGRIAIMALR